MMNAYGSDTPLEAIGREKNLKILLAHLVVGSDILLPLSQSVGSIKQERRGVSLPVESLYI